MSSLGRIWRTVRWLRPAQVWGRLRFRLQRPSPDLREAPLRRATAGPWVAPPAREASLVGPAAMRFLAETHDLDEVGWDDPSIALLWRYNQHYFDDLNAEGAAARADWQRALLQRWVDENPPGRGTAWAPYPTSLRIANWVKWSLAGHELTPACLQSLAVQTRWLMRRLEWHLLGNHLFMNAKALVFAGRFFEGPEADAWCVEGMRILQRELPEQVLADGAQFERSPMYHTLALEDVLDLLNLLVVCGTGPAAALVPELRRRAAAMLHWLRYLRHPDGTLPRFNDSAEGIGPPTDDIERYAAALGITAAAAPDEGLHLLQPSGYLRVARGHAVALLDLAPIGPDYLPGHAHADTLSMELSVKGRLLVVNRGTSVYGTGKRRLAERGTELHSTVQVGRHDSSEVWSGFRVGRRARPGPVAIEGWAVEGSHDGYTHLPGAPRHRRRWTFEADGLEVHDRLDPAAAEPAVARYHLAPGLELVAEGDNHWQVREGQRTLAQVQVTQGRGEVGTTQHAQRFGVLVPAATLAVHLQDQQARTLWRWNP
jgi:uncharacterized heparinase superfamily protein